MCWPRNQDQLPRPVHPHSASKTLKPKPSTPRIPWAAQPADCSPHPLLCSRPSVPAAFTLEQECTHGVLWGTLLFPKPDSVQGTSHCVYVHLPQVFMMLGIAWGEHMKHFCSVCRGGGRGSQRRGGPAAFAAGPGRQPARQPQAAGQVSCVWLTQASSPWLSSCNHLLSHNSLWQCWPQACRCCLELSTYCLSILRQTITACFLLRHIQSATRSAAS